jgi:hypothetical protein
MATTRWVRHFVLKVALNAQHTPRDCRWPFGRSIPSRVERRFGDKAAYLKTDAFDEGLQ